MVATVVLLIIGTLFVLMGFFIIKFKLANLIAGYDPGQVKDSDGLATWMGKCAIGTGVSALGIAVLNYLFLSASSDIFSFVAFMVLSMISGVVALAGAQTYYK
ncbi:DUF3784 domain-containing protein [uncultured Fibrella sp.]|uniref:DUF3784 domain-containing protein n=1 Tax=uncultured Fibrella sp. TaxID=1284596 RepID=UPI0035CA3D2D